MTIRDLKEIISNLPEKTIVLVEETDINDVEMIKVEYHFDGRTHLIFSTLE